MTTEDWLITLALLAAVAIVASSLRSQAKSKDSAGAAEAPETPQGSTATSAKPAAAAVPKATPVAPAASPVAPKTTPAAAATPATRQVSEPELARLDYEEDEEIDPTKIGAGAAPKRAIYQPPVQRIVYDEDAAADEPTRAESLFLVSAAAQTDTGLRRKRNEDSVLVLEASNLFVVADGMGGYKGGERASQLAVATIGDAFRSRVFEGDPHETVPAQASELARAIQMANAAILETSKREPGLEGMGTTVCAARFSANKKRLYIGHVGDSRCYRLRGDVFEAMTADHTMAEHGVQGPTAAHLSRAVGIWPTVPVDIVMGVPLADDVYLLCSDGLTKMLDNEAIGAILRAEQDLKVAVDLLIQAANARGGKDNVSVVLVRVVPPEWRPAAS